MIKEISEFETIHEKFDSELSRWMIYKHSDTCPISSRTKILLEDFSSEYPDVDIFILEVKSQRPLSKEIEAYFKIDHQSPQILLFKGDRLKDHKSHSSISIERLSHSINGGYNDKTQDSRI